ncbi:NHLP bacteriocin system secretion protein [Dendronalium sp. ChiSLP03b]|uniref:NHLP bacteriocin system secretion protein n=1 Tax=Dendronalium sp. ChiSLP03b TaxID=3075381 RepID=UPI002AD480C1|nr:NHLP bacteriocin system secretion protein [Dendronalium sp. ChiSLP03b]MDZ8202899.1 NHLP bacteriocin system secretion protein [Dendronalium sp. ChiSLP03b]
MQIKHSRIFRQTALERLSSPEQLEQAIHVVKPQGWLTLSALSFVVAVAGVWSVFGRIPLTVTGQGILIKPHHVVEFQAPSSGPLLTLNVKPGDIVKQGDVLGIIDQSALKQQLQQEQVKLQQLQTQNQETDRLQKLLIDQQIITLGQQKMDLENNLRREQSAPKLRAQTLSAIAQKRQSINSRKQQINYLLQTLKARVDNRRRLFGEHVISQDMVVQAEQEYFNTHSELSDIDVQLKDLEIQETTTQREYLENLNKIDEIKTKIKDLNTQNTKLREQDLKQSIDKANQIREVKQRLAQLELQLSQESRIISKYNGHILEVSAVPGQIINPGNRLGSIEAEKPNSQLVSLVYFANKDGKQIKSGMAVQVTPSFAKREREGGIVGAIANISSFPVTTQDITAIVGNKEIAASLAGKGEGQVQAFVQLQEDATTASGYKWSSSEGSSLKLSSGTTTSVQVKVGEKAPISYIIPILRSWTGIY